MTTEMDGDAAAPPYGLVEDIPDRAMVIFAHPDDGEIGAGGVASVWASAGCSVTFVVCTSGSSGSNDRSMDSERIVPIRQAEQKAAVEMTGVSHVEFLGHPDGGLEDDRVFRGEIVRMIRKYRPHTILTHDPHRILGFNHRDHRTTGQVVLDAVYPYARDHLHFPEQITEEGLEPHKVRRVLLWGADRPDVIVDTSSGIQRHIDALYRHESQVGGLRGGMGVGDRIKERGAQAANGYPFEYGQTYRQLIARE